MDPESFLESSGSNRMSRSNSFSLNVLISVCMLGGAKATCRSLEILKLGFENSLFGVAVEKKPFEIWLNDS